MTEKDALSSPERFERGWVCVVSTHEREMPEQGFSSVETHARGLLRVELSEQELFRENERVAWLQPKTIEQEMLRVTKVGFRRIH